MSVKRRFGCPGWRITVRLDDEWVSVRGYAVAGRARARIADVDHAGITVQGRGLRNQRFLALYGRGGSVLAMTPWYGLGGKAERAVAFVNEELRRRRAPQPTSP